MVTLKIETCNVCKTEVHEADGEHIHLIKRLRESIQIDCCHSSSIEVILVIVDDSTRLPKPRRRAFTRRARGKNGR
jgi:hypothetical protein